MKTLLNTIILLGALQGFIISLLLFCRRTAMLSNKILAWLILLMSMASLNMYFVNTGSFTSTAVLRIIANLVPLIIIMPMGPLLYFYVRSLMEHGFIMQRKYRWHFAPVLIDLVPQLTFILFYTGKLAGWWQNERSWVSFTDTYYVYSDLPRWLSLTVYTVMAGKYLSGLKGSGAAQATMIKWLGQFIKIFLVFQVIWLLYLIPYSIPALSEKLLQWVDWYPVYIPFAIMIYWLGIKGYFLMLQSPVEEKLRKQPAIGAFPERLEPILQSLQLAMERDRIYLNPSLNLERVSLHTGIAPKTISAVLNQHIGKSFNEWMNEYRLQEFKARINESNLQQLTISGIAAECGFNSPATFQRIFKQFVGMTPTEYLKSKQKNT